MVSVKTMGCKIDSLGNCIAESTILLRIHQILILLFFKCDSKQSKKNFEIPKNEILSSSIANIFLAANETYFKVIISQNKEIISLFSLFFKLSCIDKLDWQKCESGHLYEGKTHQGQIYIQYIIFG